MDTKSWLRSKIARVADDSIGRRKRRVGHGINDRISILEAQVAHILRVCDSIKDNIEDKSVGKFLQDGYLQWPLSQWRSETTTADVFWCFRLILGRVPSDGEWRAHLARVGGDLTSTVRSYLGSKEFNDRSLFGDSISGVAKCFPMTDYIIYLRDDDNVITPGILSGSYEREVVSIFNKYVRAGMGVIDVGANVGFFTMLAASLVGQSGSVLAVEPNPANVRLLEASRRANGFQNIEVALVAATEGTRVLILNAGEANGTTSLPATAAHVMEARTLVPAVSLDALVPEHRRIDFIKIDVEGAERIALSGAARLISRHHPTIVSELSPDSLVHYSGCTAKEYVEFLIDFGYHISVIEKDGNLVRCRQDAEKVLAVQALRATDHVDILAEYDPGP